MILMNARQLAAKLNELVAANPDHPALDLPVLFANSGDPYTTSSVSIDCNNEECEDLNCIDSNHARVAAFLDEH